MMKTQSENGVILITTLWILLILSVVALGFSLELHLEARLARYQIDSHEAYYLAKAGVERAMVELKNDAILDHKTRPAVYDGLDDCWSLTEDTKEIFDHVELGPGTYTVRVIDEASKLNINKATEPMFEGVFKALNFDDDDAKFYAGAIIDYRDQDSTYTFDTTQSEAEFYYPDEDTTISITKFRNGDFVSPDELLKVPGMTPEILYEPHEVYDYPDIKVRLVDLLTVEGDGVVNINTASLPVLTAVIIGLGAEDTEGAVTAAEKIIDHRDGGDDEAGTTDDQPYVNAQEVSADLGQFNPVLANRISATMKTTSYLFDIRSVGEVSKAKKEIDVLVQRDWVVTLLSDAERHEIENESKGIKQGVKLQIKRWMEL